MAATQHYYQKPSHVLAAAIGLSLLSLITTALRVLMRIKGRHPLKTDDWLSISATLLTTGIGIDLVYGVSQEAVAYRTEIPADAESPFTVLTDQIAINSKVEFAFNLLFILANGLIKASFLSFYYRIFSVRQGWLRGILIGMLLFVAMWTIAFFFATLFACGTRFWALLGTAATLTTTCSKTLKRHLVLCTTDFITDLVIIIIPIPTIWRLNMSTAKKLGVSSIFLLGALALATSITRFAIAVDALTFGFSPGMDEILTVTLNMYWGMVECGIGACAASLPTLQILFREIPWEAIANSTSSVINPLMSRFTRSTARLTNSNEDSGTLVARRVKSHKTLRRSSSSTQIKNNSYNLSEPVPRLHLGTEVYPLEEVIREEM